MKKFVVIAATAAVMLSMLAGCSGKQKSGTVNTDGSTSMADVMGALTESFREKEPDITARQMSEQTGFSTRKISRIIRNLRESGQIVRMGSSRKGYWKVNRT